MDFAETRAEQVSGQPQTNKIVSFSYSESTLDFVILGALSLWNMSSLHSQEPDCALSRANPMNKSPSYQRESN